MDNAQEKLFKELTETVKHLNRKDRSLGSCRGNERLIYRCEKKGEISTLEQSRTKAF